MKKWEGGIPVFGVYGTTCLLYILGSLFASEIFQVFSVSLFRVLGGEGGGRKRCVVLHFEEEG